MFQRTEYFLRETLVVLGDVIWDSKMWSRERRVKWSDAFRDRCEKAKTGTELSLKMT